MRPAIPPKPPRPRYRWRILVLAAVTLPLVAAGGWVGICMIDRLRASWEVQAAVAEIDRDSGWTLEEIQARRSVIPDEKNGALRFAAIPALIPQVPHPDIPLIELEPDDPDFPEQQRLRQQMKDLKEFWESTQDVEPCTALDVKQLDYLRAWHKRAEAALSQALSLADYPQGQFPLDDATTSGDCIQVINLLRDGACVLTHDKDLRRAYRCARAMLHLGNYSTSEPRLSSYRTLHVDSLRAAVESLERLLGLAQLNPTELLDLQRLLEAADRAEPGVFRSDLSRERALGHQFFQTCERGEDSTNQPVPWWDRVPSWQGVHDCLWETPRRRHAHAVYLRLITEWITACDRPWDDLVKLEQTHDHYLSVDARAERATSSLGIVSGDARASFRLRACLRCAYAAVAMERYRQEEGDWPASLETLVPHYLKQMPTDPYDGQPLRLKRLLDGIVVYSVGEDLIDNRGALRRGFMWPGRDLGFQLWDAEQRGRPAK
jgi:hypothetical protein